MSEPERSTSQARPRRFVVASRRTETISVEEELEERSDMLDRQM
jgi:hypothetical protein